MQITNTEHRFTMTLAGYDALMPLDKATQRWVQGEAATVVLDATGTPTVLSVTGEVVTCRSSWTLATERTRTGEQATVTLDAEQLQRYDTLPGIVRVIVSTAAGQISRQNNPDALLGHCSTVKYGKAVYVIQPAGNGASRGSVFHHVPADAPASWYAALTVDRRDGNLIVKTTSGHTVKLGEREVVAYAF